MPLNNEQTITVLKMLMEQKGIKTTLVEIAKGTLAVAIFSVAGGFLGGPVGLSIGGCVGSLVALKNGQGKYKSVAQVVDEMSPEHKRQLAKSVQNILRDLNASDIKMAIAVIMANSSLQTKILTVVASFLQNKIGTKILK